MSVKSRRRYYWHYGSQVFYRWVGNPWDWKAEAERGAVRAPPNPSGPQGVSGHRLLQPVRWDPALTKWNAIRQQWHKLQKWHRLQKQQFLHLKTNRFYLLGKKKKQHTFLRAVGVCAVGLRLSELEGKYQKKTKLKWKWVLFSIAHEQAIMSP